MPRLLALIHRIIKSPIPSLAVTGIISMLMLIPKASDLSALVNLFCQAGWITYGFSFLGIIILRIRQPNVDRPFKVFIGLPVIMVFVSIAFVIIPFFQNASYSFVLFCFILFGVPVYFVFIRYHHKFPKTFLVVMDFIPNILERHCGMVVCQEDNIK